MDTEMGTATHRLTRMPTSTSLWFKAMLVVARAWGMRLLSMRGSKETSSDVKEELRRQADRLDRQGVLGHARPCVCCVLCAVGQQANDVPLSKSGGRC